jgi:DNA-binding NtrC family response regulator
MISHESHRLVFIVDNEELIVRALHRVLVRAGYRTACLSSAQAARERMADETPAAVITDLNMPAEHGLSLFSSMAERYADAVVSKPCEPTQLVERLDQLLAARVKA